MSESKSHAQSATNIEALYLGPKAENKDFFKKLLIDALEKHAEWRKIYGGEDPEFITEEDIHSDGFIEVQQKIKLALDKMQIELQMSQPFFSPRYLGHMNWDILTAANIAYFQASLYNPNNVAAAGSTATSRLELEVGEDFCKLIGYDPVVGWGHLAAGGTIANIEALWMARNLKYLPISIRESMKELNIKEEIAVNISKNTVLSLAECNDETILRSLSPDDALSIYEQAERVIKRRDDSKAKKEEFDNYMDKYSLQQVGIAGIDLGVIYLPQSKHYSWKKVADILGMGRKKIEYVPVDEKYRMDTEILRKKILESGQPVLAVIGVLGSTEESSVDPLHEIVEIRKEAKNKGIGFYMHVDAAYGGYATTLFRDDDGTPLGQEKMREYLKEFGIISPDVPERHDITWPDGEVFRAFNSLHEFDSVTLDPHKLGYVQYPAGGIAIKNRMYRKCVSCFADYVFIPPKPGEPDTLIGSYILEGSKPGAAAAAVWTAHRTLPLNITGYGKLIGETIDGAQALYYALEKAAKERTFKCAGKKVFVKPLIKPDLNILIYAFNFTDNSELEPMNKLNELIFSKCFGPVPDAGRNMLSKSFIVSDTNLTPDEYGDAPKKYLSEMGVNPDQWVKGAKLRVLRSTVMSPYLTTDYVDKNYVDFFIETINRQLGSISI